MGPRGLPCTCEKGRGAHPKILFGCGYDLIFFYPKWYQTFLKKHTHLLSVFFFAQYPKGIIEAPVVELFRLNTSRDTKSNFLTLMCMRIDYE